MFTGIIETIGEIIDIKIDGTNKHFTIKSAISASLKIDQSVAHNGVCLTVIALGEGTHTVTAIQETLSVTALNTWKKGSFVNLERCVALNGRLDGHLVQGHVDTVATCTSINEQNGSWLFEFAYPEHAGHVTVPKGSITVNGTSLTVVKSEPGLFSVAIIPYTFEHTVFKFLQTNEQVNIEFDIIGMYVARLMHQS